MKTFKSSHLCRNHTYRSKNYWKVYWYKGERAEKAKLFYLSNAVGQTNRQQASLRIKSTTHRFRICLPVLNIIIVVLEYKTRRQYQLIKVLRSLSTSLKWKRKISQNIAHSMFVILRFPSAVGAMTGTELMTVSRGVEAVDGGAWTKCMVFKWSVIIC